MPEGKSLPDSAADYHYQKDPGNQGTKYSLRFLRVNRFLNRPIASLLVRAVYRTKITPNELTFLSLLIGLAGACFLFLGKPVFFAVGGILAQLSSVVDCADGMLARARKETSEFGAYLDLILDRVTEFFLTAGCVFGYFAYSGRVDFLVLGLVALALYFLLVVIYYLTEGYLGVGAKSQSAESRGLFLFLIFLFGIVNRLDLGLVVLFAVSAGMTLFLLGYFLRLPRK